MNRRTVTVCIPAHNEQENIVRTITAVLVQDQKFFSLEKVLVIVDGCTDSTAALVERVSKLDSRVVLVGDGVRRGKAGALNLGFSNATSEIVICLDADVTFSHRAVLANIVEAFDDARVGLVAGDLEPARIRTFWQKVGSVWNEVWAEVRRLFPESVHNISGCLYALRRGVYEHVRFPQGILADDEYIYFATKEKGYRFAFVRTALVNYTLPTTLAEYVLQSVRFIDTKHQIITAFGDRIGTEYYIPKRVRVIALCNEFLHKPFYTLVAGFVQFYIMCKASKVTYAHAGGIWEQSKSTK